MSADVVMLIVITAINVICSLLNLRMSYKSMRAAQITLKYTKEWSEASQGIADIVVQALADIERRISILEDEAFK